MKIFKAVVLTVVYISILKIFWNAVGADESYIDSQRALKESNFERALLYANKSIEKNSREPRYYYGRAKVYLGSTTTGKITVNKDKALADLQKAQELNPKNLVTLRNVVPIYYFLSIFDLSRVDATNNLDEKYFTATKEFYSDLKNYSPTDVGINVLLAKYEKRLGMEQEYKESLEIVERLRPDLMDWHPSLN